MIYPVTGQMYHPLKQLWNKKKKDTVVTRVQSRQPICLSVKCKPFYQDFFSRK